MKEVEGLKEKALLPQGKITPSCTETRHSHGAGGRYDLVREGKKRRKCQETR